MVPPEGRYFGVVSLGVSAQQTCLSGPSSGGAPNNEESFLLPHFTVQAATPHGPVSTSPKGVPQNY